MIFALAAVTISRAKRWLRMENNTTRIITATAEFVIIPRWFDRINNAERPFFLTLPARTAKLSAHYPKARSTNDPILDLSDKAIQLLTRQL